MNWLGAWESEVFRLYGAIVLGVLGIAGVVLAVLAWVFRKDVRSIGSTYMSWLIMAAVVFGVVFAGRVVFIVGVTLVALWGFKEFARATGLYRDWGFSCAGFAGVLAVGFASLVSQPQGDEPGNGWYGLFIALPVFVIAAILLVPICRNRFEGQLQGMCLTIVGFVYIGWMFGHLGFLANATNAHGYVLYLLVATPINDVAAFTFGRLFGRRPFRSRISPNKTWEGALGALSVSMALPWAMRFSFPHFGVTELVLTGLIVGIGGQLGDLAISVIKRDLGIKDMGVAIPGHGGILDRIDSLIYVAPLFFHMAGYFHGLR